MLSPRSVLTAIVLSVAVAGSARAAPLDYSNIPGHWCGSRSNSNWTNYRISRNTLTVIHLPAGGTTVLQIDQFDFTEMYQTDRPSVVIYYRAAGRGGQAVTPGYVLTRVQFIDFGADGQSIVQATSDTTGKYRFTR